MKSLENVKKILFDDFDGIFPRLRDGDYSITQEEKDEIACRIRGTIFIHQRYCRKIGIMEITGNKKI